MSTPEESMNCAAQQEIATEKNALCALDALDDDLSAPWRSVVWERRLLEEAMLTQQLRLLRRIAESLEKLNQRGPAGHSGNSGGEQCLR